MLLIVSIIITAELYSTFKYHMKIGETTRCCSFFLKTHVKISSKISIIEFNIQIKWCIIVTPSREAEKDYQGYFNSPPHKKNHIATTMINTVFFKISTHILTKRMTIIHSFAAPAIYISTHILTKRMTDGFPTFCILCVISTHILTKRMTTLQQLVRLSERYFNSHPHEEDDYTSFFSNDFESISTHILTKRMTCALKVSCQKHILFQLTSSRRGWQNKCWMAYFI